MRNTLHKATQTAVHWYPFLHPATTTWHVGVAVPGWVGVATGGRVRTAFSWWVGTGVLLALCVRTRSIYVSKRLLSQDLHVTVKREKAILQPVYTTDRIVLNRVSSNQFNYRSTFAPVVLNRISSIRGTAFTHVVGITQLLIWSSSIRFNLSTTVRGGTIGIESVRFDSHLHYEQNRTSSNRFKFAS